MKLDVTVTETKTHKVDISPIEVLDKAFSGKFTNITGIGYPYRGQLIKEEGEVKLKLVICEGYDYGGHYHKDPEYKVVDIPENFCQDKVELFKAYCLVKKEIEEL